MSTCAWIPRVCCSVCVPWKVCGIVIHKRQCICQGSAFPCILLCSFVQLRLCVLGASVGMPVQSAVFCCPRARGSFVFVVAPFCIRASFLACSSYPTRGLPVYGKVAVGTLQSSRLLAWSRAVLWSLGSAGNEQLRTLAWGTMSPSLRAISA